MTILGLVALSDAGAFGLVLLFAVVGYAVTRLAREWWSLRNARRQIDDNWGATDGRGGPRC